jgi:hypothetical protein
MRDSSDTGVHDEARPFDAGTRDDTRPFDACATGDTQAAPPTRRVVGVVRVLRGRLAAPCRCCSEAAAARRRHDDDDSRR